MQFQAWFFYNLAFAYAFHFNKRTHEETSAQYFQDCGMDAAEK